MTFKIADIANEAQLVEIAERLSDALSGEQTKKRPITDPEYIDAAKTLLTALSKRATPLPSGTVAFTEQEVDSFPDFDPDFINAAKDILRTFIEKTESYRQG